MLGRPADNFIEGFFADFRKLQSKAQKNEDQQLASLPRVAVTHEHNKYAALTHDDVESLRRAAHSARDRMTAAESKLLTLIKAINSAATDIISCDLPSDNPEHAAAVKSIQTNADIILKNGNLSWLSKIISIAVEAKKNGFGNCQEKAFYGFASLLYHFSNEPDLFQSLRLAFFTDHFVLVVNERFLMDPWLDLTFPIRPKQANEDICSIFEGFGKIVDYFSIDNKWQCISSQVVYGQARALDRRSNDTVRESLRFLSHHADAFTLSTNTKKRARDDIDVAENRKKAKINNDDPAVYRNGM